MIKGSRQTPRDAHPSPHSARMRAVGQRNTAAEMRLRRALWRVGLRYLANPRIAETRPDIAFRGARVAVFVDGCFWHGCPRHYGCPASNVEFWQHRLATNVARDRRNDAQLSEANWHVMRFWECEVNRDLDHLVKLVRRAVIRRGGPA